MFFKYSMEMKENFAKSTAKIYRTHLVRCLIEEYNTIAAIHKRAETPELTRFLHAFLNQIEIINTCTNPTNQFENQLQTKLNELQDHFDYQNIASSFNRCLREIQIEVKDAQTRDRNTTTNKIVKIKNYTVYTAIIPTLAMIGAAILAIFNPVGLFALGVTAATFILAESIFWLVNYKTYKTLHTKLAANDLALDYADGYAVPFSDIPQIPGQQYHNQNKKTNSKEKPGFLPADVNTLVNNVIEEGTELLSDVSSAAYQAATASVLNMWSAITKSNKPEETVINQDLHQL